LYFLGEEAAMTVRAFTSGYDLFHPCETIVWHDYVRADAAKHWDDHVDGNDVRREWSELDAHSKDKVRRLLGGEPVGLYGLGSARTLGEYEAYAGLSFSLRKAQAYTSRAEEPPNPEIASDWAEQIYTWLVRIAVERAALPPGSLDAPAFWYAGIADEHGNEIYRQDLSTAELRPLLSGPSKIVLVLEFQSGSIPSTWTLWPVGRSGDWLPKLTRPLADEDYTIVIEDGP